MNSGACPRESETWKAAVSGSWPEELAGHARACGACREVAAVSRALTSLRENAGDEPPLPTAAQVWWKAQVAQRRSALARSARPIRVVQCAAALGGSAAVVAALFVEWPRVSGWLAGWQAYWPREWQAIGFTTGVVAAVVVVGAALLGGVVLAARRILPLED